MFARIRILLADRLAKLSNLTMRPVASNYLVAVLKSRKLLTSSEAHYLNKGKPLSKLYVSRCSCDCDDEPRASQVIDSAAAAAAKHAIRVGDLAEAVLQASRCLPELKDLQYLAERRGLITHGA